MPSSRGAGAPGALALLAAFCRAEPASLAPRSSCTAARSPTPCNHNLPGNPREPLLPAGSRSAGGDAHDSDPEAGSNDTHPPRPGRWRAAAAGAMALRRVAGMRHSAGVLPGLDVKREGSAAYAAQFGHVAADAAISLIDYSRCVLISCVHVCVHVCI